jgi:hypothetical protein
MTEIKALLDDIEKLRQNLYKLINEKELSLEDSEVIAASQMLNAAINRYNEILTRKVSK